MTPSYIILMKLKLPNWGSLCNPNLLLNSDFRNGIINQQGKTSYLKGSNDWGKIYSIDMWAIQRGIQLSVNSNIISVECTNSNEPGYLLQKLDYVGKATAAINIKSITGSVSLNTAYGKYELLKKGLNIITYDFGFEQSDSWFSIRISEGSTVVIDYMKLEKGSYFTGMPVWNNSIELLKCQRYFVKLDTIPIYTIDTTNAVYYLTKNLSVDLQKVPSTTLIKVMNSFAQEQECRIVQQVITTTNIQFIELDKNIGQYGYITMLIDSYDY